MKNLTSKSWWKAAGIRAIKTFGQTLIATLGVSAIADKASLLNALYAALAAGILSLATSLAGLPEDKAESK